jgi:hypothetical protein
MTVVVVLYSGLRVGYLGKTGAGVGERGTGFGAGALTQEEQIIERFGNRPVVLIRLQRHDDRDLCAAVANPRSAASQWSTR